MLEVSHRPLFHSSSLLISSFPRCNPESSPLMMMPSTDDGIFLVHINNAWLWKRLKSVALSCRLKTPSGIHRHQRLYVVPRHSRMTRRTFKWLISPATPQISELVTTADKREYVEFSLLLISLRRVTSPAMTPSLDC